MTPTTTIRKDRSATLFLIVLGACLATMAACSTTEGFGEDVKHLGDNIENSAARNK